MLFRSTSQGGAEIDATPGFGTPSATVSGTGSAWTIGGLGFTVGGGSTGGAGMLTISAGGKVNVTHGMAVDPFALQVAEAFAR